MIGMHTLWSRLIVFLSLTLWTVLRTNLYRYFSFIFNLCFACMQRLCANPSGLISEPRTLGSIKPIQTNQVDRGYGQVNNGHSFPSCPFWKAILNTAGKYLKFVELSDRR